MAGASGSGGSGSGGTAATAGSAGVGTGGSAIGGAVGTGGGGAGAGGASGGGIAGSAGTGGGASGGGSGAAGRGGTGGASGGTSGGAGRGGSGGAAGLGGSAGRGGTSGGAGTAGGAGTGGVPSLYQKYATYFPIGAAVDSQSYTTHAPVLKTHFNSVTCENEMKWDALEPTENSFSYGNADAIVNFATHEQQEGPRPHAGLVQPEPVVGVLERLGRHGHEGRAARAHERTTSRR